MVNSSDGQFTFVVVIRTVMEPSGWVDLSVMDIGVEVIVEVAVDAPPIDEDAWTTAGTAGTSGGGMRYISGSSSFVAVAFS